MSGAVIQFLRACYQADNRDSALFNVHSDRVHHLHFLSKGGDFLRGLLDVVPAPLETSLAAQKMAELYATERALIFGAIMVEGSARLAKGEGRICAPLLLYPAFAECWENHGVLRVDYAQQRVNARMLAALLPGRADEDALDEMLARIPMAPFSNTDLLDIAQLLEEFLPGIDVSGLRAFMQPAELLNSARIEAPAPRASWQHCMAVTPVSPETRGILAELKTLGQTSQFSPALRALLGRKTRLRKQWRRPADLPLATLSAAQRSALEAARTYPLTVLHGPPGTGKSFTAAVLALQEVMAGKSVLIAARTEQALDAIHQKLNEMVGADNLFLRSEGGHFLGARKMLDHWLEQPRRSRPQPTSPSRPPKPTKIAEQAWAELRQRAEWERIVAQGGDGLLRKWRLFKANWELRSAPLWMEQVSRCEHQISEAETIARQEVRRRIEEELAAALRRRRKHVRTLRSAFGARTTQRQNELLGEIPRRVLFRAFPLWLTTLSSAYDIMPLQEAMFDLAIIDEATQCDMAGALPILQRARRVVIAGDPRQLRHVSFLSFQRQKMMAEQLLPESDRDDLLQRYNYRDKSLLDLALEQITSPGQIVFLDEHFRSRAPIIEFSNREFYQGKLKVMRFHEGAPSQALRFRRVNGERNHQRVNHAEAEAVLAQLRERIEKARDLVQPPSIGVLSPFRQQVALLERLIDREFSLEAIRRHKLRVGTAYSFQGDERDVMLLSLALDDKSHATAFRYLDRPDVFNVTVTRARHEQTVYYSFTPEQRESRSLARRYLETSIDLVPSHTNPTDQGIEALASKLSRSFKVEKGMNTPLGTLDLVVRGSGGTIGLAVGPHEDSIFFSTEGVGVLHRCGLKVRPVSRRELQGCEDKIMKAVHRETGRGENEKEKARTG